MGIDVFPIIPTLQPGKEENNPFTIELPNAAGIQDVFGLWIPRQTQTNSRNVYFQGNIGAVWRANLPEDPQVAGDLLEVHDFQLRLVQNALPGFEQRLKHDLLGLTRQNTTGETSFSAGSEENHHLRSILAAGLQYQGTGVSFSLLDGIKIDPLQLDKVAQMVASFSEQVQRNVDQLTLVETVRDGRRLAITRTAWSGDIETWWAAGTGPGQRILHEQVLAQALATRQGWLRFLLVLAGGITRVAASIAAGPFSLVSIWTTWNYLQEVIKEFRSAAAPAGNLPAGMENH
jgi:hypothetical protein